jgi:hypothetical protein
VAIELVNLLVVKSFSHYKDNFAVNTMFIMIAAAEFIAIVEVKHPIITSSIHQL